MRALLIAAVVLGVVLVVRSLDLDALGAALASAQAWPLLAAAVINFGIIAVKAVAWRWLLAPAYRVSVVRLVRYALASSAASTIAPLRAGELVRLWLLRARDGVPLARGAAVAVAEKLLDAVSMLILVAPLPWLVRDLPAALDRWIPALALALVVALLVICAGGRRLSPETRLGRFAAGFAPVRRPRTFVAVTAVLLVGWLIDLAMIHLVLRAVGIELPIEAGVLVLATLNLAIALPSTPGQVGALEVGALVGLRLLGVPEAEGLAFALLYHAVQMIPVLVAGLALNADAVLARREPGS
ncbi:MAG TPA: lysylphosphatidylglycerol synthase transmembrane domain-containing protein [Kofleriaceae bacterium]|nr:lysylphosphatidylglycerol synthase transmembrane domain-containing protein [Kofleriaceae bacterium]